MSQVGPDPDSSWWANPQKMHTLLIFICFYQKLFSIKYNGFAIYQNSLLGVSHEIWYLMPTKLCENESFRVKSCGPPTSNVSWQAFISEGLLHLLDDSLRKKALPLQGQSHNSLLQNDVGRVNLRASIRLTNIWMRHRSSCHSGQYVPGSENLLLQPGGSVDGLIWAVDCHTLF